MLAVFKKEMHSYFTSVIGYVFLVIYLALGGALFAYTTLYAMSADVTTFYTLMLIFSAIILPLLHTKAVAKEDAIEVSWQGAGTNEAVTQYYALGGNVISAPAMADYVGNAIKLSVTGWNEAFPENITENVTMTPVVSAKANITASINLSLYSDFYINLYIPVEYKDYITNASDYTEVTVNGNTYLMATTKQAVADAANAAVFEISISENGYTATATASVSVAAYAEAILSSESYTAADKQLMYYTVAYAAEAAEYFGKAANETLETLLTTYADAKGEALAEKTYSGAISDEVISATLGNVFNKVTISVESAPKFVFTLNDGFAGTVTVSYGGNVKTYEVSATDSRTIVVDGMKAYNFGATITITAEGTATANGTYNLDTYAAWATANGNDTTKAIVEAFYDYVTVAASYKAALEA